MENKIECTHCGKFFSKYGIKNHIAIVHMKDIKRVQGNKGKTHTAWNKGLTRETDERINKQFINFSESYMNGNFDVWCKGLTKENDERINQMAKSISDTVNEKIKNDNWHVSFAHSRIIEYKGIKFHGSWEVAFAKYLDENKVNWRRPTEKFEYEFEGKKRYYTPDFYLIDEKKYIEIKGYPTDKDKAKWDYFPLDLRIIYGKELFALGLIDSYKEIK